MRTDESLPTRKRQRLTGWDYSEPAVYFTTVCTDSHAFLFGTVEDGTMMLNPAGRMVEETWNGLGEHIPGVEMDQSVVMPNHVHGIVALVGSQSGPTLDGGPTRRSAPTTISYSGHPAYPRRSRVNVIPHPG
jgi:putative transposase